MQNETNMKFTILGIMKVTILEIFLKNFMGHVDNMATTEHSYSTDYLNPYHLEGDVWTHTMMVYNAISDDNVVLLLAALLHDIGKPISHEVDIDTNKTIFHGHAGIGYYIAVDILDVYLSKNIINVEEKNTILWLISNHQKLYDHIQGDKIVKLEELAKYFAGKEEEYSLLIKLIEADRIGRISKKTQEIPEEFYTLYIDDTIYDIEPGQPKLTLLIGPPGSGKTTYCNDLCMDANDTPPVFISRVDYVEQIGRGETYTEKWKSLSNEEHKEIDKIIMREFQTSVKHQRDIIVNMTNMSKKKRKKWINQVDKTYYKEAIVFQVSYNNLIERNRKRAGKILPECVIHNMMKAFRYPGYDEFDKVTLVENENTKLDVIELSDVCDEQIEYTPIHELYKTWQGLDSENNLQVM